jgi:ribosome recycling factor
MSVLAENVNAILRKKTHSKLNQDRSLLKQELQIIRHNSAHFSRLKALLVEYVSFFLLYFY